MIERGHLRHSMFAKIPGCRYHVKAWGSEKYPDLDYFAHEVPKDLSWKYPCVSAALLDPISYEAINRGLSERGL